VTDKYALMPCGASMGDGYGPIVVGKHSTFNAQRSTLNAQSARDELAVREFLAGKKIAVPGKMTSAFLALQLFMGEFDYVVVPFDQIFDAVKNKRADAGLIIHEGQLTYARSGFAKIVDLGAWWKHQTGLPLPLGGNVLRKDIPPAKQHDIVQIIRESINYGLAHRDEAVRHSLPYARDMNADLAGKFIGMYVNDYTRDYGETGREAIRRFLGDAHRTGYIDKQIDVTFVE
jgi:1,4-dihydroxy-6-naphthoate synthase